MLESLITKQRFQQRKKAFSPIAPIGEKPVLQELLIVFSNRIWPMAFVG
jgi:hypothetical protein